MRDVEDKIKALPDWPLFCKAKAVDDLSCSDDSIISPLGYLEKLAGKNWMDKSQKELDDVWKMYRKSGMYWKATKLLYNKESKIDETGKVTYARFLISFGAPLDMSSKKSLTDET